LLTIGVSEIPLELEDNTIIPFENKLIAPTVHISHSYSFNISCFFYSNKLLESCQRYITPEYNIQINKDKRLIRKAFAPSESFAFTLQDDGSQAFVLLGINFTDSFEPMYIYSKDTTLCRQKPSLEQKQYDFIFDTCMKNIFALGMRKFKLVYSQEVKKMIVPSLLNIFGFTPESYYNDIPYVISKL
ncbi:2813_t:CDS:2, partial [Dentiscutata heterogama]